MFNTLLQITNVINQMNQTDTQSRVLMASLVASLTLNYLFNVSHCRT